jgi:KaiC/GvpD/RAD55 family RecA-like ATPase
MKVRIVILPEGEDPDSYIRKNSIDSFKELACWSAFEWRLQQYEEEDDSTIICQQMIPFIVNESSPVAREQLCKALVKRTGVSLKAINQELDILLDARSARRSRDRQEVLERAMYSIRNNPNEAEIIFQKSLQSLSDVTKKHDSDSLSNEDFVRDLDEQKSLEEDENNSDTGFELGEDLADLRNVLRGAWSEDVFMAIGGIANSGKSSLLSKIAYEIAVNNEDVTVIYHTIDDSRAQLIPRFVCIAEGSRSLTMNMVRQPNYWIKQLDWVQNKRVDGYKTIRSLAKDGRLVIKDMVHGMSLPFTENLIRYYKDKFPSRRVVYILDNIHKLRDFEGKDERVRFKTISEACKGISLRQHICFMGSVEYTKMSPGTRPSNNSVSESVQLQYDTNFIGHLYNEVADLPDSFTVCHKGIDWQKETVLFPRVEMIIGKNKITEQKKSIFFDFFPASSDFKRVSQAQVVQDSQLMKESRKSQGSYLEDPIDSMFSSKEK